MLVEKLSERLSLLGILERVFKGRSRDSGGLGGDADSAALERRHRYSKSFLFLEKKIVRRENDVLIGNARGSGTANSELVFRLTDAHSFFVHAMDERGHTFVPFRGVHRRE